MLSELGFELADDAGRAQPWMLARENIAMLRRLVAEAQELLKTIRLALYTHKVGAASLTAEAHLGGAATNQLRR
jgi:hypothetical protein